MIIGATCMLFASFITMTALASPSAERSAIESGWVIFAMVCYPLASLFINEFNGKELWLGLLIGFLADVVIMISARFRFKSREWYYAILPLGVMIPVALVNVLGLTADERIFILAPCYMICMFIMEGIGWSLDEERKGDAMLIAGSVVFGVATILAKAVPAVLAVALLLMAIAFGTRGWFKKKQTLAEASIYLMVGAIIALIIEFLAKNDGVVMTVLIAHAVFASFAVTSLLFEKPAKLTPATVHKKPPIRTRLIAGCASLLVLMGATSLISGQIWVMGIFMAEAMVVLICGIIFKYRVLWIAGAIALFGAIMWFTRGMSYVWPVVLGLGLIGSVIGIIVYNDKKK